MPLSGGGMEEALMNQFRRFMYGRYGVDRFSQALIYMTLAVSIIATFSRYRMIFLVSYALLAYAIFRMISKNISKRSQENMIYCRLMGSIKKSLNQIKLSLIGTKTHKYYKCKHCRQMIRVPRGKGKICITCPKCRAEFVKRT
jgi:hypothetical protein